MEEDWETQEQAAAGILDEDEQAQEENHQQQQQQDEEEEEEDEEEDILDMGEDAVMDDREALLMRFCPHDSSMLYPQVR